MEYGRIPCELCGSDKYEEKPIEVKPTPKQRHIYACSFCGLSGAMEAMKEHFIKNESHKLQTVVGSIDYLYSETP